MESSKAGIEQVQSWAINGRFLTQRMTGVQRYAHEIVAALDELLSESRDPVRKLSFRLIVPPGVRTEVALSNIAACRTGWGSGHVWDQFVLPIHAAGGVLNLGNFGPVFSRKSLVCIHDANVFIEPESYSTLFGLAYRTFLPLIGRRAIKIATVSQFSMDMLVKYGVCRRDKIFIAPNGHEHALRWDASRAQAPVLKALKRPFILLLGSKAKHKNVEIILEVAAELDAAGIDVVVVGAESGIFSAAAPDIRRLNIHQAGYVGDDDLAALYERALCLVFPSKTEGFGIPPLEAMTRGCPVISSDAASLVEVGGDAVAYVNPDDRRGWLEAIVGLSGNEDRRAAMAARGRQRALLFSWKRSAQLYLEEMLRLTA